MQIFALVYLSKEIYSDKGCNYYKDHKDALTNDIEVLSNLGLQTILIYDCFLGPFTIWTLLWK